MTKPLITYLEARHFEKLMDAWALDRFGEVLEEQYLLLYFFAPLMTDDPTTDLRAPWWACDEEGGWPDKARGVWDRDRKRWVERDD